MGCYDEVMVPCPSCGEKSAFQSKGGCCSLTVYELGDAPPDVLLDVNRHAPNVCEQCGCAFKVAVNLITTSSPVLVDTGSQRWLTDVSQVAEASMASLEGSLITLDGRGRELKKAALDEIKRRIANKEDKT